ncbi:MAG: NAD(+)/NADH kinase [Alphaproteobacteria bacterium]|nr:NAD(+)/NADH kinase [Alphaproteobacteria bacterium]
MLLPRVVVVTRPTEYDSLLAHWGTRGQVDFFLKARGRSVDEVDEAHAAQVAALDAVSRATPPRWRRASVGRGDLDRFLFEPEDLIVAVGQDGLVANVAKYLDGQPVIGVNPDPQRVEGVMMRHRPQDVQELLHAAAAGRLPVEARTLVQARADDGQTLLALNEVFLGHKAHQSARYLLRWGQRRERHSSSGLIVATGTGATGWAASIHRSTHSGLPLPAPTDPHLIFFAREPWPSRHTGTRLTEGVLEPGDALSLTFELGEGAVVFGDGLEADRLELRWGQEVTVSRSTRSLHLAA